MVGTYPKSILKALVSDTLYASPSCLLTGRGYSSKRQAPDVTANPNSQCVIALLPKSKSYIIYYFEDG